MEGSQMVDASDYVDDQPQQFPIDGLMEGDRYLFSAQAQNQFGSSPFSGNSDIIDAGIGMLYMCTCNVSRYLFQYPVFVCSCMHMCTCACMNRWLEYLFSAHAQINLVP